jgi:hypothetical protein
LLKFYIASIVISLITNFIFFIGVSKFGICRTSNNDIYGKFKNKIIDTEISMDSLNIRHIRNMCLLSLIPISNLLQSVAMILFLIPPKQSVQE